MLRLDNRLGVVTSLIIISLMLTEIDNTIKYGKQRSGFGMHATYSVNRWRKIAGKGKDYLLQIRSNTWLMDLRLEKGQQIVLPKAPAESCGNLHR